MGFDGLTKAFDVDDEDIEKKIIDIENNIKLIEIKKTDLVNQSNAPSIFKDEEYIQSELKSLIFNARMIVDKVEMDIKIGADSRKIEVYAKLVESIGKQYVSLLELNKQVFQAQLLVNSVDINNIGDDKISLSSEQLLNMINSASENSQLKKIDANFKIENIE